MKNNKKQSGFSIIEVLIVLAIAGLIMVVVFLAVPNLQRNSRNTQRRTDVTNTLGAVAEYVANNQGKVPADNADFTTNVENNVKLGIYTAANITYATTVPGTLPAASADSFYVYAAAKCNSNAPVGSNARAYAAYFWVETSAGTQSQCLEG